MAEEQKPEISHLQQENLRMLRQEHLSYGWRPIMKQALWAVSAAVAIALAVGAIYLLVVWAWDALNEYVEPETSTQRRDLVQTFALIVAGLVGATSAVVGLVGLYFSRGNLRQQRELEEERAQRAALQAYLEQMEKMMIDTDEPLHSAEPTSSRSALARAQTVAILGGLDGSRKATVVRFLYESGLVALKQPIVSISGADLTGSDLRNVKLNYSNLSGASFPGPTLRHADLRSASLEQADLRNVNLDGAKLTGVNLRRANLVGASLVNAQGASLDDKRTVLENTPLTSARLTGINLRGAIMSRADLELAILIKADLRNANLTFANFRGADLFRADLRGADLSYANLCSEPSLQTTIPHFTNLTSAKLQGAVLVEANLQGLDFRKAKGLTQDQIESAIGSIETDLPKGLDRSELWGKSIEEQTKILRERQNGAD